MNGRASRVGIVGAGVAGLACAQELHHAGVQVTLYDKGRAPGGRLSTRRGEFAFDHGAQYFTADDERFRAEVTIWETRGVVAEWTGRVVAVNTPGVVTSTTARKRLVGVPGMRALAAHLAEPLDVRCSVAVASVEYDEGVWVLHDDDGQCLGSFEAIVLTAPPEQTAALLGVRGRGLSFTDVSPGNIVEPRAQATSRSGVATAGAIAGIVADVSMAPCLALMAAWEEDLGLPYDGAFVNVGPLSWVARDGSKPGRFNPHTWVIHAGRSWSTANLDTLTDTLVAPLLDAFAEVAARPLPPPQHAVVHRWRYAQPVTPLDARCLLDDATRLVVAGDWCGGPRVEGAWLSGHDAAGRILDMR